MAFVGGILFLLLLIGAACLVWFTRGRKIQGTARKVASAAASDAKSVETKAQAAVNAADQVIRKI